MRLDVTRAWKDEAYRQSLAAEQHNFLPANPAAEGLRDTALETVSGGCLNLERETSSLALSVCEVTVFTVNVALLVSANILTGPADNCKGTR